MSADIEKFLFGGDTVPPFKFGKTGDRITGAITEMVLLNQIDYKTKKIVTFDSGEPIKQLVLTLAVDDEDYRVFVRGGLRRALIKELDGTMPKIGDTLDIELLEYEGKAGEAKEFRVKHSARK